MFLLPMAFIVLTALMTDGQAKTPDFWPHPFQWGNFLDVFDRIPLLRYTLNTVTISTLATVGIVAVVHPRRLRALADAVARAGTPRSSSCSPRSCCRCR